MRLEWILGEVLADVGGDAGRVVDGRTGEVLAAVGARSLADVAGLLVAARDAPPVAGDLVVAAAGAVHVLRGVAGPFVHVRLRAGPTSPRPAGPWPTRRCRRRSGRARSAGGARPGRVHTACPTSSGRGPGIRKGATSTLRPVAGSTTPP